MRRQTRDRRATRSSAFAGLKTELVKFAMQLPGSRILDGRFMVVRHTAGTPRGRGKAGEAYLDAFVEAVKAEGLVAQWIVKSGVQGLSAAPPASPAQS